MENDPQVRKFTLEELLLQKDNLTDTPSSLPDWRPNILCLHLRARQMASHTGKVINLSTE